MVLRKLVMVASLAESAVAALPAAALADDGHRHGWDHEHDHDDDDDDDDDRRGYYRYHQSYYDDGPVYYRERYSEPRGYYVRCSQGCRTSGTTGLIVGGAAGALLGRELDRYGDRTPGTIIGAGAGALLGRKVARKHRC